VSHKKGNTGNSAITERDGLTNNPK